MKKICPKCNINTIKNFYSKGCADCYKKSRINIKYCLDCGKQLSHSITKRCKDCFPKSNSGENSGSWKGGLPKCKICDNKLSVYKNSSQYHTGICQKCYKGSLTKRWNFELTKDERENGRTINPEYTQWRIKVFERDDYSCQKCGDNKGGNLIAHHIQSYQKHKELRTDINNGITLCKSCHIIYHKQYGWKNSNLKDFNKFIV